MPKRKILRLFLRIFEDTLQPNMFNENNYAYYMWEHKLIIPFFLFERIIQNTRIKTFLNNC